MKCLEKLIIQYIYRDINDLILKYIKNKNIFEDIDIQKVITTFNSKNSYMLKKKKKIMNCPHKDKDYYAKVINC